ncbi:6748_t:CDS:1 [Dentiscutata heterogama]|uniref:6748_t:CDS:1 n=1 Tax=Dentiscutata heterogama TaxID=1316150 RepID=A0ACA9M3W2_9GLOM|nr:6748_t:CDS:1 [Dentiscutata heterogama]
MYSPFATFVGFLFFLFLILVTYNSATFFLEFSHFSTTNQIINELRCTNCTNTLGYEHVYVINLEYRIDRRKKMEALGDYLGLDLDIIKAVNKFDNGALSRLNMSNLEAGPKACYLSHYSVIESIVKNGYKNTMILEDDVDMELNITDIMSEVHRNLPNNWDILYLGSCHEEGNELLKTNLTIHKLHKSGYPKCTHAYAVSIKGAKKLLKKLKINNTADKIDREIPALITAGEIIGYSIYPQIVVQFKGVNDLSDVTPGRKKPSRTYPLMNSTLLYLGYNPNIPDS